MPVFPHSIFRGVALALAVAAVHAAPAAGDARWISLFDGKTLRGWKQLDGQAKFEVRDGTIVGIVTPGVPQDSFLVTEAEFGDLILECEFRCDAGLNSGVQFRSRPPNETVKRVHGYQYEIDPTPRALTAGVYEEGGKLRRGWLAPAANHGEPQQAWVKKHGDVLKPGWNSLRVEARGSQVRTWLNGQLMADLEDNDPVAIRRGFVGVQVHQSQDAKLFGKEVAFRNLRVQRLD